MVRIRIIGDRDRAVLLAGATRRGGEGYQLLFTAPAEVVEAARAVNPAITPIGEVVAGKPQVTVLDENGKQVEPGTIGFEHFST